ncbi:hypothetical protein HY450_03225 [Candidatus Pacearchaeota archaeon]|nr:hypothetical protein [Candidatus Pacearchaeota archaeon]
MTKKAVMFLFAFLLTLSSLNFASAYYFGNFGNDYYNSYSYTASRSYGYNNGPVFTRTTDYNKLNDYQYLDDGTYQRTTIYTKVVRESPWYVNYWQSPINYRPYQRYYVYSYPRYYGCNFFC